MSKELKQEILDNLCPVCGYTRVWFSSDMRTITVSCLYCRAIILSRKIAFWSRMHYRYLILIRYVKGVFKWEKS